MKIKVDHSINIDSSQRNKSAYKKPEKFSIKLQEKLKNVHSIRLTSIEIPNVDYALVDCKFTINSKLITLVDGSYCASELAEYIHELIGEAGLTMDATLNENNGKLTFASNDAFTLNFGKNPIREILGFTKESYNNVTSITSEHIMNALGNNYFFLSVNGYGTTWNNSFQKRYLAKVLLDKDKFFMIYDTNNTISRSHVFNTPTTISHFDIELRDKNDNLVNLNNADYSFTLSYTVYEDVITHDEENAHVKYHMPVTYIVNQPNDENEKQEEKKAYSTKFILKILLVLFCIAVIGVSFFRKSSNSSRIE